MATILVPKELEEQFCDLVATWEEDTQFLSSIPRIVAHPAYQRIIALGEPVLPLIFRDLHNRQSLWFWALRYITGEDPVGENQAGKAAVAEWQQWGKSRGYLV